MRNIRRSKLLLVLALSLLLIFTLGACGNNNDDPADDDAPADDSAVNEVDWDFYTERAERFILAMADGNFDEAHDMLNPEVLEALHDLGAELQDIWDDNIAQAGAFLSIYETEHFAEGELYAILITAKHEDSGVRGLVAFTDEGLIAGWQILGFPRLEAAEPTEFESYTAYPILIGEGTAFPLDGMLFMPTGEAGQVPAVLIVGGSGSHDMDGRTAGLTNTIYRDIAEYLAENGIASIRYDRRLYAHTERALETFGDTLTVREEIIEDALLAVDLLRADPRIDSDRIYIIGHSLGGMLAPRIHAEADFAGLILMAATPRHMLELAIEQYRTLISTAIEIELLEESDFEALIAQVDELDELFHTLADLSEEEARETLLPLLNVMAYYFRDMAVHPFADYMQDLTVPVLVMQGGRDFQVLADVDFVLLQELFAGWDTVTFRLYEDLNHAFIPTTAENFFAHSESIAAPGQVYTEVLQDIVTWILEQ